MALLDISLVTQALIRVVKVSVIRSRVWTGTATRWQDVPVVPLPPDQLEQNTLGIYLYHLTEDAHFKNQPSASADVPPVRYTPMGLNLHYQLSINAEEDETHLYRTQLLMGLAVKALHDYPILTDATEISYETSSGIAETVRIFDEECEPLRDAENRIRLSLQPIPHNEAAGFWTANSAPMRLSAYYQASVILLEPEEPDTRSTRVLRYGVHTFLAGAPRLDGSENTLTFDVPEMGVPQQLKLRPAEVPLGSPPDSRVTFTGVDLAGDETHLLLRSARWTTARQADATWSIVVTANRVLAAVGETIDSEDVLPDMYAASVRVIRHRTLPDGSVRSFEQTSNETPFTITPRIDAIGGPDVGGLVTINGYPFQHDDLEPENLQVYLGAERLTRGTAGALERMEFTVTNATTLQLRLPAGLTPGEYVPFRLLINGAESAPRWIEVPA